MHRPFATALLLLTPWAWPTLAAAPDTGTDADLNCVILPDEQVEVSSAVPGVIEEVLVQRSDRVEHGQVLARLESSVEEATVALASARAQTDAEIRLRRVELNYDMQHRDRLQALHVQSVVSSQSREDAQRAADVAQLRLRLAQDRHREARLERHRADARLALKTIRSPIDGVIVERHRTVGEYVEDQPILRVVRLDPLRIEVIAPLRLFGAVQEGMQMGIRPETDPERERIATVSAVDVVADPGSGTFGVQLELPNPDLELPAGIKCKGRLLPQFAVDTVHPGPADAGVSGGPVSVTSGKANSPADSMTSPEAGTAASAGMAPLAPIAAAALTLEVPGRCLTYQALEDEGTARSLARAAQRLGVRAELQVVSSPRVFSYIVVTPPEPQPERRRALAKQLRAAGITDLTIFGRGVYAGRISLGVYHGPRSAHRRRAALAALGFESEVQPRTRAQRTWRLDVGLPPGLEPDVVRAALSRDAGDTIVESGACGPLMTAGR